MCAPFGRQCLHASWRCMAPNSVIIHECVQDFNAYFYLFYKRASHLPRNLLIFYSSFPFLTVIPYFSMSFCQKHLFFVSGIYWNFVQSPTQRLYTVKIYPFVLDKKGIEFSFSLCYNTSTKCGYNLSVECDLPKVDRWVRLPLPAPHWAPILCDWCPVPLFYRRGESYGSECRN